MKKESAVIQKDKFGKIRKVSYGMTLTQMIDRFFKSLKSIRR